MSPVILEAGESPEVTSGWILGQADRSLGESSGQVENLLVSHDGDSLAHGLFAEGIIKFFDACSQIVHLIVVFPKGHFENKDEP